MNYMHKRKWDEQQQNRKEIYLFIVRYFKTHGYAPSIAEITEEVDIHKNTVQNHMRQLEMDGLIKTENPGISRAYTVVGYEFKKRA